MSRWLGLTLIGISGLVWMGLLVALTADGLIVVTARHTLQQALIERLPSLFRPRQPDDARRGRLIGQVVDPHGQPISGAMVIVADRFGRAYRATTGADGGYQIDRLPAGPYRPVAAAPGFGPVADLITVPTPWPQIGTLRWRPTVGIAAEAISRADLRLTPPRRLLPTPGARLEFEPEVVIESGGAFPARAHRQGFRFVTERRVTHGVIYAPETGGPYPSVLIIYPGLPETWENVSVPLAAGGFTIVAFTPLNFPDLEADTTDLLALTEALDQGRLSRHAAPGRQCAAGGSFSTIWTFLLLQETNAYRCALTLGGIGDAYLYYADYTAGRITPNPQFAPVPQMMTAMGWPDLAPDLFLRLTAVEHLTSLPPLLIIHGSGDSIVLTNQSQALADRLQALGRPVELRLYDGMEHYLAASHADADTTDLLERTLAFFKKYLT